MKMVSLILDILHHNYNASVFVQLILTSERKLVKVGVIILVVVT